MTPEKQADIAERYAWKPGEREALEADTAERAERERRDRSDENLAWCEARKAERQQPEQDRPHHAVQGQTMDEGYWKSWRAFVRKTMEADLRKAQLVVADGIGEVLGRCEKRHKDAIDDLRTELAALRTELAELRAEARTRSALNELAERLDRIEDRTARPPLKAIGTALRA